VDQQILDLLASERREPFIAALLTIVGALQESRPSAQN
jgi:hypothetical protein